MVTLMESADSRVAAVREAAVEPLAALLLAAADGACLSTLLHSRTRLEPC